MIVAAQPQGQKGNKLFLLQVVLVATTSPLSGFIGCLILLCHISWYRNFNAFSR